MLSLYSRTQNTLFVIISSAEDRFTRCNLSAAILFKLVDSYLIAFKFAQ